ncbi:MAG TPA: Do family serine endopeptidase [Ignavibacteria bacterium]|nr:Do family serine endopeptidase [Ignavibacteria bacterium]
MKKKSIFAGAILLLIALSFGAILIAALSKGNLKAGSSGIEFKTTPPITNINPSVTDMNNAFVEISKAVTPTVVYIEVTNKGKSNNKGDQKVPEGFEFFFGPDQDFGEQMPSQGSGSGVIISNDGYIMTNNHVVANASEHGIRVVLTDKREFEAKLIGTDPNTDVAVIKIEGSGFPTATIGNSDNVQVGQWVLAVGNPLGLNNTVTSGIVSALGRNVQVSGDAYSINNFIQTDAAINPGNSGGALVDISGSVIGINAAIKSNTGYFQGYGFAIPINLARNVADELIRSGKITRGYIGVQIKDVDMKEAKGLGLDKARGVLVQGVVKGGAGEEAGVQIGDIILKVDGQEVNASNQLQTIIGQKRPGDAVSLEIFRDGNTLNKSVTLKPRAEDNDALAKNMSNDNNQSESFNSKSFESIGLSVSDMAGSMLKNMDISKGVLVTNVQMMSEAYQRGIRKGFVILQADKQDVSSVEDLNSILNNKNKGDVIILKVMTPEKEVRIIALGL